MSSNTYNPHYGERMRWNSDGALAGIPTLTYNHSLEQVHAMIGHSKKWVEECMFFTDLGMDPDPDLDKYKMIVRNIGTREHAEWVVPHEEFQRWLRAHRIPIYQF